MPVILSKFKKLKHKTKKSFMLKIGQTESQVEDQEFAHLLSTLKEAKQLLRDIYNASRAVANSGKKFNKDLEKLLGFGLRDEDVFNKDAEFLSTLEERLCTALGRIVNRDINKLNDAIVDYKKAKLKFDALHHKTVKKMRKSGQTVKVENADDVMNADPILFDLNEKYLESKAQVRVLRDVIIAHLNTDVKDRLEELRGVSEAEHHQLYCQKFDERLRKTIEIVSEESNEEVSRLVRGNTFSHHRSSARSTKMHRSTTLLPPRNVFNVDGSAEASSFSGYNNMRAYDEKDAERDSLRSAGSFLHQQNASQDQVEGALIAEKAQQAGGSNYQSQQNDSSSGVEVPKTHIAG
jgi:hypothetical protein